MNPLRTIQIGHSKYEKIDEQTVKTLCVQCGGKGFYLLMQGFPSDIKSKGELVGCDECEQGFKYSQLATNNNNG